MEIERKFLTKEIPFSLEGFVCKQIIQSYISFEPTIRIRKSNEQYFLTVKGKGHMAREEFEIPIQQQEYDRLLEKIEGNEVRKKRYYIPLERGYMAELDIYEGQLEGLFTTEVEFPTMEEAESFVPLTWLGEDITKDRRYKNTFLARYGKPKAVK
ncbi:CYTH domain-containing protein [Anaerotignum sp. MB30-C6]|uniref:CYTH domain-containing protein n=1 Tax=Anaerotignum sp. MB30-C6 TaxID=3070814 RepID=UPI0027DCF9D5|nr:CYTH domain-containing protein [Anaerotignum sp. MB30-C6]WMI81554.1 CYTH domain-containing protein [Anaerotignum sp. MB30-C6]